MGARQMGRIGRMGRVLKFAPLGADGRRPRVGRLHRDGSISFDGKRYATLKEVPPECTSLRPDVATHCQWRAIYRAIDPRRRPARPR